MVFLHVVIVGCGKVGFTLAEQLVKENHDIIIVDTLENSLRQASDTLDVMTVRGSGISAAALRNARIERADLLIAVTDSDEVNMVCCLAGKNMGAKYTIARIRNPEYTSGLDALRHNMGIDMVINPENATANEIARLLRFPAAANIQTFCRGQVELIGLRLQEGDFVIGKPLRELSAQIKKLPLLFCAAERGDEVIVPNGNFVPLAGDRLYVIGQPESLDHFLRVLGRYAPKIRNVFIVGGGKISLYLARILSEMKFKVKLVEQNEARCRIISEQVPGAIVLCGDGTDQDLLESERALASDAFVALTDRDEDNLIISLYAIQKGLPKVVAKSNRQNYASIARAFGLDSVVSPKLITAQQILQVVRGMNNSQGSVMNALYRIADGTAEAMEFFISLSTRNLGIPLRDLHLKPGILIAVIVRGPEIIIPEGSTCLHAGDTVILVARESGILDVNDIYLKDTDQSEGYSGTGGTK